jgi:hypothetical protein
LKYRDPSTNGYIKLACAMILLAIRDGRKPHGWQARRWLMTTGEEWIETLDLNIDIAEVTKVPDYEELLKK